VSDDGLPGKQFDYMLSNPPFGVEWKKIQKEVKQGAQSRAASTVASARAAASQRWLAAVPDAPDLQDAPDQRRRQSLRHRLNGSPLFTGNAGSGESEIRRYVLENDLLEAIIGLPTDMFYNTGISTYIWIVTNRKPAIARAKCS
jgi:type I restriction enzyme M protein